ncbi:MAG: grasp-with-spasm system ATP-grasp peptide maturase [Cellulophaga sp.]
MILILSKNNDYSTGEVIRWILAYKIKFLRLNEDDNIKIIKYDDKELIFKKGNVSYSLNDFTSVWYRRGGLSIQSDKENDYLRLENREIINSIYRRLIRKRHINTYFNSHLNKLYVLDYDGFIHVKIPPYLITQSKRILLEFMNSRNQKIISKPMFVPFSKVNNNAFYMAYTSMVEPKDVINLNKTFVPTFFQEYVEKKYEIRTFFLDGNFYSMCIFSQQNKKTSIDFRNYDHDRPNRVSPFKLPLEIEEDLRIMLGFYKMDSASLDIIFDGDIFNLLDVNPIGQFGMVSNPCNYYLEERIANYLIKKND